MKPTEFQELLFQSAVSMMAIDGIIHDHEKEELLNIVKKTPYFFDFEFNDHLDNNLILLKKEGKDAINNLLDTISGSELNEKQELILIEVLLKIIEADDNISNDEVKFLHLIKSRLKTTEETLISRFPRQIEYLFDFNNFSKLLTFDSELKIN